MTVAITKSVILTIDHRNLSEGVLQACTNMGTGRLSIDARYLCHICYARVIVHGLSLGDDPSGNVLDKRQSVSSHKWNEVK